MIHAGIDLSLRSTGLTILKDGELADFSLVSNEQQGEELVVANSTDILDFLQKHKPDKITIEGLAFGGKSGSMDIIQGNHWFLRCSIWLLFIDVPVEIVAVSRWRKYVIPKERAKVLRDLGEKEWQKKECVDKLPLNVKEEFERYIKANGFSKKQIYDLTDSYWISKYAVLTEPK